MMNIIDLDKEEREIFLAESKEQLEILESGLVRLEKGGEYDLVIQELFRAAHTLKGSAGMIDHKSMVALTHSLENSLDDVRKEVISVSPELIDLCLSAADGVWLMLDEIAGNTDQSYNIDPLVERFRSFRESSPESDDAFSLRQIPDVSDGRTVFTLSGDVDPDSFAPAARVLQAIMGLENMGEVVRTVPERGEIERAKRVRHFSIEIVSDHSPEELLNEIIDIPDLWHCRADRAGDQEIAESPAVKPPEAVGESPQTPSHRLGDYLIENEFIRPEDLDRAIRIQGQSGEERLLGRILVDEGMLSQEHLDRVLLAMTQNLRSNIKEMETSLDQTRRIRAEDQTIRTSVERLDMLMNEVGELITDRNRLIQLNTTLEKLYREDLDIRVLGETITHLGRTIDQLQNDVMGLRMLPIANVFKKYPRMVRDLARLENKNVQLTMDGQETDLDRSVVEAISDPIIHLIRNAVGHGIESPEIRQRIGKPEMGTINLSARHERGQIIITVSDDGAGVDVEKVIRKAVSKGHITAGEAETISDEEALYLIFESGVSTAKSINKISGRGVGMDIVRNNIEQLNGSISVSNWPGEGMQVEITLPLNLAVIPTLLVTVARSVLAIPLAAVTETLRIPTSEVQRVDGEPIIMLRGRPLPLAYLRDTLKFDSNLEDSRYGNIVAVRLGTSQVGLVVDDFLREEEVMLKSLGILSGKVPGLSGGAVLGDGKIALILDVVNLIKMIENNKCKKTSMQSVG